ncbi:MAG: diguanylate cyclase [Gallionella sp.]|nr:diguanylate cyclase [Gallionella sp.]
MNKPTQSPSDLARETLKTLASRKTPPTPENYATIYAEISGIDGEKNHGGENNGAEGVLLGIADSLAQTAKSSPAGITLRKVIRAGDWGQCLREIEKFLPKAGGSENTPHWAELIRELLRQLEATHKGLTITRKKEGLETVLARFSSNPETLFEKLTGLVHSWAGSQAAVIEVDSVPGSVPAVMTPAPASAVAVAPVAGSNAEMIGKVSELLAQALESLLSMLPELTQDVQSLTGQVRATQTPDQLAALTKQLRQFWIKVELRAGDNARGHDGLVRLLRLLVENIGEMIDDEDWLFGQIAILQEIIDKPMDRCAIADAERSLRNAIIKQGMLKQSLNEAKSTLKSLMTNFIDRLGEITESTGEYHQKIEGYSKKIGKSSNISELSHLLEDIMHDTRTIQVSALRSHDELVGTRKQVQEAEAKIKQLEQELNQVSELVQQDQLTGALNRRGMDAAFEREATRADRSHHPLCVALLDIDNFKRLNDTLGHQAGDQALIHLSSVIKETLRPSDSVSRYGGEEFVIVLPEVGLEEAAATVERLQRELTKKFFLHENDRVLVTFSAGVAQRAPEESQDDVIGRADKAMYEAKKTGKNRVVVAK